MNAKRGTFMRPSIFGLTLLAAALSVAGAAAAPQKPGGSSNPACALLTVDEIRKITGFPGYSQPSPGDALGEGVGGGASCQYERNLFQVVGGKAVIPPKGPLLSIVIINGKNYTQSVPIGKGCHKETVAGVGDAAFFEVCPPGKLKRTAPLYVKAGSTDLLLQLDIEAPDTDASLRPKLVALARAAIAKVR
jgi:hypothetical protein